MFAKMRVARRIPTHYFSRGSCMFVTAKWVMWLSDYHPSSGGELLNFGGCNACKRLGSLVSALISWCIGGWNYRFCYSYKLWSSLSHLGPWHKSFNLTTHPRNLTWNRKIMVSKWTFLFQGLIFRFHVKFRGCTKYGILAWLRKHVAKTESWI